MHVLRRFREAVLPRGILLDLQVVRPHPRIESAGRTVYIADASPLFEWADAARAAVDRLVEEGLLVEEAVDEHDVLTHHRDGASLVEDWPEKRRKPPPEAISLLEAIPGECMVRERCRLRLLRPSDGRRP